MIVSRKYAKLQRISVRLDTYDLRKIITDYIGEQGYIIGELQFEWDQDEDYNTICTVTSTAERPDENENQ